MPWIRCEFYGLAFGQIRINDAIGDLGDKAIVSLYSLHEDLRNWILLGTAMLNQKGAVLNSLPNCQAYPIEEDYPDINAHRPTDPQYTPENMWEVRIVGSLDKENNAVTILIPTKLYNTLKEKPCA